jgi:energy-coupling factor transporter ATP-binding protein EcfA2
MIRLKSIQFNYGDQSPILSDLNLTVNNGEVALINGASGCGKSTLLNLIYGILDNKSDQSLIQIDDKNILDLSLEDRAHLIGYVFQDIDLQLCSQNVISEIRLGLEYQNLPEAEIEKIATKYLKLADLNYRKNQSVASLSGGQKQKLILVSILALKPKVILLDEPFAQLDVVSAMEMSKFLIDIAREENISIIVCEHRTHFFKNYDIKRFTMVDGKLNEFISRPEPYVQLSHKPTLEPIIQVDKLKVTLSNQYEIIRGLNLTIHSGERVAVIGSNGSGKTTLFQSIVHLIDYSGEIQAPTSIGFLFQNPDLMLTQFTVKRSVSDRHIRKRLDIDQLSDQHPLTLSKGQRLRVAYGQIFEKLPDLLILDEPTSGQDIQHINQLLNTINENPDLTVLCSSHDIDFILAFSSRIIIMNMGEIVYDQANRNQKDEILAQLQAAK